MKQDFDDFFIKNLKEAYEIAISDSETDEIPKEAVKNGTIVKSLRHDRTGIVVDSFYGDYDKDNQKIIIYTVLLLPDNRFTTSSSSSLDSSQYYFTNEYEYEVIAYLMVPPLNIGGLLDKTDKGEKI